MQARENPRVVLDEVEYELEFWTVSDCFDWQQRLMKLGLEPLAVFLSSVVNEDDGLQRWDSVGETEYPVIARTLLQNLKAEPIAKVVKQLLSGAQRVVMREGGEVIEPVTGKDYEHRYKGMTMHLYKLAGWAIVENMRDFTDAARLLEKVLRSSLSSGSKSEFEPEEKTEPQGPAASSPSEPGEPSTP